MKGAALFFTDMLVRDPRNNYLVTAPTTSPENAYRMPNGKVVHICAGSTMDNQIVRELFTNTIAAANILGIDSAFCQELADKRSRLMPTTIGKDGRILEWLEPYEEVEPLVHQILAAYEDRINELDWMGEATKEKAIRKLEHMTLKIGYPDHWPD